MSVRISADCNTKMGHTCVDSSYTRLALAMDRLLDAVNFMCTVNEGKTMVPTRLEYSGKDTMYIIGMCLGDMISAAGGGVESSSTASH